MALRATRPTRCRSAAAASAAGGCMLAAGLGGSRPRFDHLQKIAVGRFALPVFRADGVLDDTPVAINDEGLRVAGDSVARWQHALRVEEYRERQPHLIDEGPHGRDPVFILADSEHDEI